ncbi:hypothetical protein CQ020_03650 [Arthrobacter sp. MYb23]|nr:hypothetical protein CQ038_03505 [Arthrobacter sp. MYb51]PRB98567.1 hypothetical protein CQ020_03650 [Arthrobacter sp. MYb23]
MKFYRAILKEQRTLAGIFVNEGRSFPAGTEISATKTHGTCDWWNSFRQSGQRHDRRTVGAALYELRSAGLPDPRPATKAHARRKQ